MRSRCARRMCHYGCAHTDVHIRMCHYGCATTGLHIRMCHYGCAHTGVHRMCKPGSDLRRVSSVEVAGSVDGRVSGKGEQRHA